MRNKNKLHSFKEKSLSLGTMVLLMIMLVVLAGCGPTTPGSTPENAPSSALTDRATQHTQEENIAAYIKAQGYEAVMNSGIGFDVYIPKKDRENNRAFFANLNEQSKLNGYDFSDYLDKPLQYVAMAIDSEGTTKDISFLCSNGQIVGVWIDSSSREHLTTRGILMAYNFVCDDQELLKFQSKYVGDNTNVINLMYALPYVNGVKPTGCELQTEHEPYGIIINCQGYGTDTRDGQPYFKNAAVIFSLIENVDMVTFNIQGNNGSVPFEFSRSEIEAHFQQDVRNCVNNRADFANFVRTVLDSNWEGPGTI